MKVARWGFLVYSNYMPQRVTLFIDGENFMHKVQDVIRRGKTNGVDLDVTRINLNKLLDHALNGLLISRKIFYAARLHQHAETKEKSKELILLQRNLKTNLEKQGFEFIIAGNVRAQTIKAKGETDVIFREKGVDVRIAVDMVTGACDKVIDVAVLCSSDSDLQPAVAELRKRDVEVIYLGFEMNPNKGLTFTSNRTILLRNSEILDALPDNKQSNQHR